MALFVPQAHAALLGADAVLDKLDDSLVASAATTAAVGAATGSVSPIVINKAGSYPLALCCRFAGVPVLVVSSDLKVNNA